MGASPNDGATRALLAPFLHPVALVADGCADGRIVGEGLAERAERCVAGVVGLIRAATGGLLSKICLGALAARTGRAGRHGTESSRSSRVESSRARCRDALRRGPVS